MSHRYAELAFTAAVKGAQDRYGTRLENERRSHGAGPNDGLDFREIAFVGRRDSFDLASVSQTGWPYVQHRGGPPGFLKVLDSRRLAFADFRGNRQSISVGNLAGNDRVALFLMDYPNRLRLKILGRLNLRDVTEAEFGRVEQPRPHRCRSGCSVWLPSRARLATGIGASTSRRATLRHSCARR